MELKTATTKKVCNQIFCHNFRVRWLAMFNNKSIFCKMKYYTGKYNKIILSNWTKYDFRNIELHETKMSSCDKK